MPITPRREALATLAVATEPEGRSLLDVLQRADPTFSAQMGLDPRDPPKRFRSAAGFEVDVIQARELIDALRVSDPDAVADALADARRRGTRWKAHVDRSLRDLGLDDAHLL